MHGRPEPGWIGATLSAARQPPRAPRVPLAIGSCTVGSIEAGLAARLCTALPDRIRLASSEVATLAGEAEGALHAVAHWLRAHDLTEGWRDELLAVMDDRNRTLARVERGAVRPLGIRTRAVHLVGYTAQGSLWMQQRARDKAVDPGQWDTLRGGLLAADETVEQALERELWEEAGLHLAQLEELARGTIARVERPLERGYMVEDVEPYFALVPPGLEPHNLDGEVERFERVPLAGLAQLIAGPGVTLEARLTLVAYLRRASRPAEDAG
ncbi:MAG: NUDIX domain-containing protein [Burkholderiales bacterium]|nr:MAG: NUDIX domain-containing protein [Burkholderiales bacterium]